MKKANLKVKFVVIGLIILSLGLLAISKTQAVGEDTQNIVHKNAKETKPEDFFDRLSYEYDRQGAQKGKEQEAKIAEYIPDNLIVKLKEGKTVEDIKELNAKYNVVLSEKLFQETASPEDILMKLKDKLAKLGTKHDKWFWQLDKKSQEYKDYAAKIEKEKEGLVKQIQAQEELIARLEARQKRVPEGITAPKLNNIYVLTTKEKNNVSLMVADYKADSNVEYAEPNYFYKTEMVPNDPYYASSNSWGQGYNDLWGLHAIKMEKAWDITQGQGAIVAVVDTGIDYNHEDIQTNIWSNAGEIPDNGKDDDCNGYIDDIRGWDFTACAQFSSDGTCVTPKSPDKDPMDGHGHGTHVAGTIAAVGNNSKGIIGVAPASKVMPVKGLNDQGYGVNDELAKGIVYAAKEGADVINDSWGSTEQSQVIADAISFAYASGCTVVNAAGNSNADVVGFYPASDPHGICVAAVDYSLAKSSFSNFGIRIDVAAPGRDILSLLAQNSTFPPVGGKYTHLNGTSMAAPHVSGLAALIISLRADWNVDQVRAALRLNAMKNGGVVGTDKILGDGCILGYETVSFSSSTQNPPAIYGWLNDNQFQDINKASVTLNGTVGGYGFSSYEVYAAPYVSSGGESGYQWQLLCSGLNPVNNGKLGIVDTTKLKDGYYYLKLVVHNNLTLYRQSHVSKL